MSVTWIDNQEEFESLVESVTRVVADFSAPAWCVPCQRLAPHFEAASDESDAVFVAVDVDNAQWAMLEYGIQGVPTIMLFENGKYVKHLKERTAPKLLAEINE